MTDEPDVTTPAGGLRGSSPAAGVHAFLGVPYAKPPVGDLRWKPPQKLAPWPSVRDATRTGPASLQRNRSRTSIMDFGDEPSSEDCLYLNIWAPREGTRLPVMLWIHGGGFYYGSGSLPLYDGTALARRGVVLVTINYRLGPLGFLAHPSLTAEGDGTSGNYGFLDQIATLEWVRDNIEAFGGDPSNVTIFGQSVGSSSVNCLMASPLARGLFHRAIAQSGGSMSPLGSVGAGSMLTLSQAEQTGLEFAGRLGCTTIEDLRRKSAQDIQFLALPETASPAEAAAALVFTRRSGWLIVDGKVINESVFDTFRNGRQADVPFISGWTSDEGSVALGTASRETLTGDAIRIFGPHANSVLERYSRIDNDPADIARHITGDRGFIWQNWMAVRLHAKTARSPAYCYQFKRRSPVPAGLTYLENDGAKLGAFHTAELPYVFETLSTRQWAWTQGDRNLSALMADYWTNFARTGDPNGSSAPLWPRFDPATQPVFTFDEMPIAETAADPEMLQFWDDYYAAARNPSPGA